MHYLSGSLNLLLASIPPKTWEIDFCDCLTSDLGWKNTLCLVPAAFAAPDLYGGSSRPPDSAVGAPAAKASKTGFAKICVRLAIKTGLVWRLVTPPCFCWGAVSHQMLGP